MAEYYSGKVDYTLTIEGKYYNTLDIEGFSLMMKDPSYCYKFYWLEAIVKLISEGFKETNFNEIIDLSQVEALAFQSGWENDATGKPTIPVYKYIPVS